MSDHDQQTDQQTDDPKGLRAQLEALREENKSLKSDRRQRAYVDAGIPEGARDIFDKTYDGELSVDALREFGKSKGFALADLGGSDNAPAAKPEVQQGQARLDAVDAASLPTDAPDLKTQILEAVAAGDWDKSRALKHELLNEQRTQTRQASAI